MARGITSARAPSNEEIRESSNLYRRSAGRWPSAEREEAEGVSSSARDDSVASVSSRSPTASRSRCLRPGWEQHANGGRGVAVARSSSASGLGSEPSLSALSMRHIRAREQCTRLPMTSPGRSCGTAREGRVVTAVSPPRSGARYSTRTRAGAREEVLASSAKVAADRTPPPQREGRAHPAGDRGGEVRRGTRARWRRTSCERSRSRTPRRVPVAARSPRLDRSLVDEGRSGSRAG